MALTKLAIHSFRNINKLELTPGPAFNLIVGVNGSGKTSLLEAIHFLSLARSFRTRNYHKVIAFDKTHLTVFAELEDQTTLGVEKHRSGATKVRINSEELSTAAQLAAILPVCALGSDSYQVLNGAAQSRRHFLDWGVFHVEPQFLATWRETHRILRQRSAGLQQKVSVTQIKIWDELLVLQAELLDRQRLTYWQRFVIVFKQLLSQLCSFDVECRYYRGWDAEKEYSAVLQDNRAKDLSLGYTQFGPQRADLQFYTDNRLAKDVLSRGQQKLLVLAVCLAQGMLLFDNKGRRCVYLIDDLAAELDEQNCGLVIDLLKAINAQVFITCVDEQSVKRVLQFPELKKFHVKQGEQVAG